VKAGDLVRHKRFNDYYLVVKVDNSAMVGVITQSGEVKYIAQGWLEVISESR